MLKNKSYLLYGIAIAISIGLTALSIYHHPLFNNDALTYLFYAKVYVEKGLHLTLAGYGWPFYSVIIGMIHEITKLSFLNSAYCFSFVTSALIVLVFVLLIEALGSVDNSPATPTCQQTLGESKKYLWSAMIVILACHQFNDYRVDIIRGHGYWLFLLLSLWCFIKFSRSLSWRAAAGWFVAIVMASLFRIEGGCLLLFAPFVVWTWGCYSWKQRLLSFIKLNLLTFVLVLIGIVYIAKYGTYECRHIMTLLGQIKYGLLRSIALFSHRVLILKQHLLGRTGEVTAPHFLSFGMLGVYVFTVISTLSVTYSVLCGYALWKRLMPAASAAQRVLWIYVVINIAITVVFYGQHLFLSERYVFPMVLVLLTYVPFGLLGLYQHWKRLPRKRCWVIGWLFPIICLLMLSMFVSSVYPFGTSKRYIYQTGQWINQNTDVSARLCSNNEQLVYFAERYTKYSSDPATWQLGALHNCDYVVLVMKRHQSLQPVQKLMPALSLTQMKRFQNSRGDRAFIFKVKAPTDSRAGFYSCSDVINDPRFVCTFMGHAIHNGHLRYKEQK